ncbi:MAG: ABC transporter ATP-binding protein [Planctomycetota bacterium]|nr:MAG: ABC transporter ATP-binding protein [Planctomycetota bacterium]
MNGTEIRETILSVESVSKIYKMGEVEVPALRDATIDILDGEFLMVVGPSGSGKSTLLNMIGGMDRPTSGTVRFLDQDITKATDHQLTLYRRSKIGFVFQFFNLIPTLTALDNVQVALEITSGTMEPMEALRLVDLEDRAGHFPSQLSGGEQQRAALARALAGNPRLLLCDEPTGALDLENSRQVLGMLVRLKRELGKTVVLITHNNAISALGDRIAMMRDGTIHSIQLNKEPKPVEEIEW